MTPNNRASEIVQPIIERVKYIRDDIIKQSNNEKVGDCLMFIPIDKKYFGLGVVYLVIYDGKTKDVRWYVAEPMCSHVGEDKEFDEYIQGRYTSNQKLKKIDIFGENTFDIKLSEHYAKNLASKFTLLWNNGINNYDNNEYLRTDYRKDWLLTHWTIRTIKGDTSGQA